MERAATSSLRFRSRLPVRGAGPPARGSRAASSTLPTVGAACLGAAAGVVGGEVAGGATEGCSVGGCDEVTTGEELGGGGGAKAGDEGGEA